MHLWNEIDFLVFVDKICLCSVTQHAKKSFFIITCIQILYNLCGTLQIVGFLTNIFKETGSILTEKDSSLFIVVVQLIANLVFLAIVERFNRRVCIRCCKWIWIYALNEWTFGIDMHFFINSFADPLRRFSPVDNSQLRIVCRVWISLEQTVWTRVDASNLYSCSFLFRVYGDITIAICNNGRAITKKSIHKCLTRMDSILPDDQIFYCLFRFASLASHFLPRCSGF